MRRIILIAALAAACASTSPEPTEHRVTTMQTLVNLHPDEQRARLYAVNYQQQGLIPICSDVEMMQLTRKRLMFRVLETNKVYYYVNHKAAAEPFEQHIDRFFGPECDLDAVKRLGEADRDGIRTGMVSLGMTKQGVIFALGYPPRHVTPNLDSTSWIYWKNRFNRISVTFDESGVVTGILD